MSKHPKFSEYVAAAMEKEFLGAKTYYCSSCSCCTKTECKSPAEAFGIEDPTGEVKYVVSYKIECKESNVSVNFDRPGNINTNAMGPCYRGALIEHREPQSCATCIHATEKIVPVNAERRLQGKTKKANYQNCKIYRTLYRCRHPARSLDYESGTYMSAYIKCPNYKPK